LLWPGAVIVMIGAATLIGSRRAAPGAFLNLPDGRLEADRR
jgi:hypothetical protein